MIENCAKVREFTLDAVALINPQPKRKPYRNRKLLNLAHDVQTCFMLSPVCKGISPHGCEPAHSDFSEHGKSKAQKSDDDQHAAICHDCHVWFGEKHWARDELKMLFESARNRTFAYYKRQGWLEKVGYTQRVEFMRTGELL